MRLHFTEVDLRKITLMPPNQLEEARQSLRRLRFRPAPGQAARPPGLVQWVRRTHTSVTARAGILCELDPGGSFSPDFLFQEAEDFNTAVTMVAETPTEHLASDIAQLPNPAHGSRQLRDLAEGTTNARQGLAKDLRSYFGSSLAELWPQVRASATADRALRAETLLRSGVDGLLATLVTLWRWSPPVLHIPSPCMPGVDVPLGGRGLVLVPSYFGGGPGVVYRPEKPTVLIYPMHVGETVVKGIDTLGPLLGRTRAAVLAAAHHPSSTTAVAERVGISLPAASQHTAALRNAGLLTTTRTGSSVLHTLTPLGKALLRGDTRTR